MSAKWLELLKEVAPGIRKVAILFKPKVAVLGGAYSLPGELPIQAPTYFELVLNLQDREGDGTRNTARDPVARRRADRMRRREFVLGSVGGALASSVDIARAQPRKVWRIGLITGLARPHSFSTSLLGGFANGMLELGYVEDRDYIAEWRFADGQYEGLPGFMADFIRMQVDVIMLGSTAAIPVAKRATASIPIVLAYSVDPVGNGFVDSLARPGGNITGLASSSDNSSPKRLELLTAMVPICVEFGIVSNPDSPVQQAARTAEAAARDAGLSSVVIEARTFVELENVFAMMSEPRLQALVIMPDSFFNARRDRIAALAIENKMPTIFAQREYAEAGGLMAYGESTGEFYRRAASYVDKILKGAKPANLPMEQPTRFFFTVNLSTAKALGTRGAYVPSRPSRRDHRLIFVLSNVWQGWMNPVGWRRSRQASSRRCRRAAGRVGNFICAARSE